MELFLLNMRLHIIYHTHNESPAVDEIINYQNSVLDWIIKLVYFIIVQLMFDAVLYYIGISNINVINLYHLPVLLFLNN